MRFLLVPLVLIAPGLAVAQGRPRIAVVGVHGDGVQSDVALRAVADDLVAGFVATGAFDVVLPDVARKPLRAARDRIVQAVFLGAAGDAFAKGRLEYEAGRFDEAIDELGRAEALLGDGAEFLRDPRLPVETQLLLGFSSLSVGDEDAARDAFAEVVRLAPDRVIDTLEYPPRFVLVFDAVRRGVLADQGAELSVEGDVADARIYVDGRLAGTKSARLAPLPAGLHGVLVESDTAGRWFDTVRLERGGNAVATYALARRGLGRQDGDPWEGPRSRLSRALYREIAAAAGTDLVALAAFDEDGNLRVALYSARSDTFSVWLRTSIQASPGARTAVVTQLVSRLALYADAGGAIKSERADSELPPMRLGANPVLTDMLFAEPPEETPTRVAQRDEPERVRKGPKPGAVVGVVVGLLAGAGAATGIALGVDALTHPEGVLTVRIP